MEGQCHPSPELSPHLLPVALRSSELWAVPFQYVEVPKIKAGFEQRCIGSVSLPCLPSREDCVQAGPRSVQFVLC